MRIIITGGAGFIGHHLCGELLKEGNELLVIDNLSTGREHFVPNGVRFIKMDIRSPKIGQLVKEFEPEIVIHLAAVSYVPYCNAHPEETFDVNVVGTRNVAEAAKDAIFLFSSTAAIYPDSPRPLTEDIKPSPTEMYGKTKLIAEDIVKLMSKKSIIARVFNVYGPNDTNPHLIPEILMQVKNGNNQIKLGNLAPVRDYVHVKDACQAFIHLLRKKAYGVYNIGTGKGYSVREVLQTIAEILDRKLHLIHDESKVRKVDKVSLVADIRRISEIGWRPKIDFKEGLRKLILDEKI